MKHPSSLMWFRWSAGDLSLWETASLTWHCALCAECSAKRDRERVRQEPTLTPVRWVPALAAVLALFVWWGLPADEDGLRAKGGARFDVWKNGSALDSTCAPGDVLQAEAEAAGQYLLVLGVAPSGAVTVLFPVDAQPHRLTEGRFRLPHSWRLDRETGTERFVAFFTHEPFTATDAKRALETGKPPTAESVMLERQCRKSP